MTGKRLQIGELGRTVVENVKRLRTEQRLNYTELSERLTSCGRGINAAGVRRIEDGERRVDVDDLAALATALGVSIPSLLDYDSADHHRSQVLRWLVAEDDFKHGRNQKKLTMPYTINNSVVAS